MKTILYAAAAIALLSPAGASAAALSYTFGDVFTYGPLAGSPFTFTLEYDTDMVPTGGTASSSYWRGSFGTLTAGTGSATFFAATVANMDTPDTVTFEGDVGSIVFEDSSASLLTDTRLPTSATLSSFPRLLVSFADAYGGGGLYEGAPRGVPEPATWAMMIAGFGVVGGAMRRRRAMGRRPA